MTVFAGFSGRDVIRKFEKIGYHAIRQRGSHVRLIHSDPTRKKITVPLHKEIGVGLLLQLIKDAGIENEIFLGL